MNVLGRLTERYLGTGVVGSTERRLELLVMVLALLLILQLLYSAVSLATLSEPEAIPPSLEGTGASQLASVERVTAEQREEVGARPLFWTSRRPAPRSAADGPEGPDARRGQLGKVDILGVFGSGATAGVIVKVEDNRQRILLGEELLGWSLEAVHPDRVDFSRDGEQQTLALEQGRVAAASRTPGSPGAKAADRKPMRDAAARAQRRKATTPRSGTAEPRDKDNDNKGTPPARLGFGR